jgi:hypothetical protein
LLRLRLESNNLVSKWFLRRFDTIKVGEHALKVDLEVDVMSL